MKKISKILITLTSAIFLLGISACDTDEFLEVDHYSILDSESNVYERR